MSTFIKTITAAAVLLMVAGCGGSSSSDGGVGSESTVGRNASTTGQYKSLRFTFETRTEYVLGEPVPLKLTVKNVGTEAVESVIGVYLDADVMRDNQLIWRRHKNVVYTSDIKTLTLEPGQSRTFEDTWKQTDQQQRSQVPAGTYTIKPWFSADRIDGVDLLSLEEQRDKLGTEPVQITIR